MSLSPWSCQKLCWLLYLLFTAFSLSSQLDALPQLKIIKWSEGKGNANMLCLTNRQNIIPFFQGSFLLKLTASAALNVSSTKFLKIHFFLFVAEALVLWKTPCHIHKKNSCSFILHLLFSCQGKYYFMSYCPFIFPPLNFQFTTKLLEIFLWSIKRVYIFGKIIYYKLYVAFIFSPRIEDFFFIFLKVFLSSYFKLSNLSVLALNDLFVSCPNL